MKSTWSSGQVGKKSIKQVFLQPSFESGIVGSDVETLLWNSTELFNQAEDFQEFLCFMFLFLTS